MLGSCKSSWIVNLKISLSAQAIDPLGSVGFRTGDLRGLGKELTRKHSVVVVSTIMNVVRTFKRAPSNSTECPDIAAEYFERARKASFPSPFKAYCASHRQCFECTCCLWNIFAGKDPCAGLRACLDCTVSVVSEMEISVMMFWETLLFKLQSKCIAQF